MKTKRILILATLSLLFSSSALAQTSDNELLAYGTVQENSLNSADDDIFAAMQALDEVGALLDIKKETAQSENDVDLDELLVAASAPEPAKTESPKPEIVPELKHDVQTAPAKDEVEKPVIAAAPKHDVQTAPAKDEVEKPVIAAAPKHDVQTAPAKDETPKPVIAAAPKHDIQTAPTKDETPKPVIAAAPKHDVQTAPTKDETPKPVIVATAKKDNATPGIAPDGTHVTQTAQNSTVTPLPASAPHTLPMTYVMAIYKLNGVDLSKIKQPMPTIAELYQHAFSKKLVYQTTRPAIGDLVFFHNTADRNRDGRWNDWHTLVGIVESIDADETISVLIYPKDHIERIHLNLKYPELQKGRKGQELNSQLRADEGAQKGTASKLFAGFANLLGNATSVTVVDNWKPGMKL